MTDTDHIKSVAPEAGILFDLDGVLLDSEGQYSIFWHRIGEIYDTGIPNFADFIKGSNLGQILAYFPDEEVRAEINRLLIENEKNMRYEFFLGALELVKALKEAGLPMAIVTSSDQKKMSSLYSQHPDFPTLFDKIVTGDMVTKSKPDPECYLIAAEQLGMDINRCIVLEDSKNGLLAGRASGARVVGLATTLSRQTVEPLSDLTVDTVADLNVQQLLNCPHKDK